MVDHAAMAAAARSCGYPALADLILSDRLSAAQVARLLQTSASRDRGYIAAVVLIAGATARHHASPQDWNGDVEKALALAALGDGDGFDKACERARKIVSLHWQEMAQGRHRLRGGAHRHPFHQ